MKTQKEKKRWLQGCILIISLLIFAPQASAHDLWIGLDHYDQKVGNTAKVFLHMGHSLPFSDFARPEKMKDFFYLEPTGKKKNFILKKYDPESFFVSSDCFQRKISDTVTISLKDLPVYAAFFTSGTKAVAS